MSIFYRLLSILVIFSLVLPLVACKSSGGATIRFDLLAEPQNLDPQFLTSEEARMIVRGCMEGLFVPGEDGEALPAVAESYETSADGLSWTFKLREDSFYSGEDKQPVTSFDFKFALTRLFSSDYPSPYAGDFLAIKNAPEVLSGVRPKTALGISAPDSRTLKVDLRYEVPHLPRLLSSVAALPCNEEFYQSARGRYGLSDDMLLYNGPFTLFSWEQHEKDRYLQLRKNAYYRQPDTVLPSRVTFYIKDEAERLSRFSEGKTDGAVLSYSQVAGLKSGKVSYAKFEDTVWALVFNQNNKFLDDGDVRRALLSVVDERSFSPQLSEDMVYTNVFCPPSILVYGESYRALSGYEGEETFNPALAGELYKSASPSPPDVLNILTSDSGSHPLVGAAIQKSWRDSFKLRVNLVKKPEPELIKTVMDGDFDVAILPLQPESSDPRAFLGRFASDSPGNFTGYGSEAFDGILNESLTSGSTERQVDIIKRLERQLLADAVLLPLYFQTHYYAQNRGVSGIKFSPFLGDTSFVNADK